MLRPPPPQLVTFPKILIQPRILIFCKLHNYPIPIFPLYIWHLKVAFCKNIRNKLKWNGSHSDEAGEWSLSKDPSKLKSCLFEPLAPSRGETEENKACNIYENQVPSSSSMVNIKWCKCGKLFVPDNFLKAKLKAIFLWWSCLWKAFSSLLLMKL